MNPEPPVAQEESSLEIDGQSTLQKTEDADLRSAQTGGEGRSVGSMELDIITPFSRPWGLQHDTVHLEQLRGSDRASARLDSERVLCHERDRRSLFDALLWSKTVAKRRS